MKAARRSLGGIKSTTGYGELAVLKKLNSVWNDEGHCIRLQQSRGPVVISDLIFGSTHLGQTYSIEVKKVKESMGNVRARSDMQFVKPRHLDFKTDFSITTLEHEQYKHQLERQVKLSRLMGWVPVVLLHVVHPKGHGRPTRFLFSSERLYDYWVSGHRVLPCEKFEEFHEWALARKLMKGDTKWIKTSETK